MTAQTIQTKLATDTKANYQNTYLSLGSTLNLQYLSSLLGEAQKDEDVVKRTVRGFEAARFLQALGYRYPFTPVLVGAVLMVLVAIVFNNLSASEERHYPVTWF